MLRLVGIAKTVYSPRTSANIPLSTPQPLVLQGVAVEKLTLWLDSCANEAGQVLACHANTHRRTCRGIAGHPVPARMVQRRTGVCGSSGASSALLGNAPFQAYDSSSWSTTWLARSAFLNLGGQALWFWVVNSLNIRTNAFIAPGVAHPRRPKARDMQHDFGIERLGKVRLAGGLGVGNRGQSNISKGNVAAGI